MSVAVVPVLPEVSSGTQQDLLVLDTSTSTIYSELDRELDRALCKQYLQIWLRHQGTPALYEQALTFEMLEAAADRLATHAGEQIDI